VNIAHVLSSFQIGGQEIMAVELASRQFARGHRVAAITLEGAKPGPLEAAFTRAGVETVHVPKLGPRFDLTLPVRLARVLRRNKVEVVHLHNPLAMLYGTLAGKLAGCAVVVTRHGMLEGKGLQLWLRRHVGRLVDGYVAVTSLVADNTRTHGLAIGPKIVVVENGIDLGQHEPRPECRSQVRSEWGIPETALVIGTVCRLVDYKNVDMLLRCCLPRLSPQTCLIVVGDGPDRAALESLAAGHANGKFVRFLGQRSDVPRLLNGFDLFALPSKTEGHPLAVIEAMATCLPVLATKVGGLPEVIEHGVTGFLAEANDDAFATCLARALDVSSNWPAMGRAAKTVAHQRFSSEKMADHYLSVYQKVRSASAREPGKTTDNS
jgi:glycosyltransferase involved in cell wall biosynthesis